MAEQQLIDLYRRVFTVAEFFLREAEPFLTGLDVSKLETINPTVNQMVDTLRRLHAVIGVLANDSYKHEDMKINALQCVLIMEQIAVCIENSNSKRVVQLIVDLEKLTNAPIL